MPRWTTRSQVSLQPVLEQLGVRTAFTEAAAATAVSIGLSGAPAQASELTLDRPFLYVVHDNADPARLTPLFIGRVLDPTA